MKRICLALYVLGCLATTAAVVLWFVGIWSYGHEHASRYGGSGTLSFVIAVAAFGSGWLIRNQ